jgi:SPP1 gp7 family putative phage head morphogenesis protein
LDAETLRQAVKNLNLGKKYANAIYDDMRILVEAGFESAKEFLDLSLTFDVTPSVAMSELRTHADDFGSLVVKREQQALFDTIDQALAEGWTSKKTADQLLSTLKDGYHVYDDQGLLVRVIPTQDWATMVARTELSRAQTLGNLALYRAAQIEKVLYSTTEGANVCDECAPDDGKIFPIDDAPEIPRHPNCCCAFIAADADVNPKAEAA